MIINLIVLVKKWLGSFFTMETLTMYYFIDGGGYAYKASNGVIFS
jgi:hypothetical protein